MKPTILRTNPQFFKKLVGYHGLVSIQDDPLAQLKIEGFTDYNYLVDINRCFSPSASGDIIDRTNTIDMPFNMHIQRVWQDPVNEGITLNDFFKSRVCELTESGHKVNLFWSGGIDSTSMLVGFLKHCNDLSKIRILYSSDSMKENPSFFLSLNDNQDIEMLEFGGDVYLTQDLDGIFVTADGADDLTASLDKSFFDTVYYKGLFANWRDLFFKQTNDKKFIDFCERYFANSTRPIDSVIDARWWFYTLCKIQKWTPAVANALQDNQPLPIGFFDCYQFEHFMFYNMDQILGDKSYGSYKKFLKDYIFEFDKNKRYYTTKTKVNSGQLAIYAEKKITLESKQHIMMLSDGTRIRTDNLPLLSELEYRRTYVDSLDYLFNK